MSSSDSLLFHFAQLFNQDKDEDKLYIQHRQKTNRQTYNRCADKEETTRQRDTAKEETKRQIVDRDTKRQSDKGTNRQTHKQNLGNKKREGHNKKVASLR